MKRILTAAALLGLASCGEPVELANSTGPSNEPGAGALVSEARPVRIGELGPNFQACGGAGTTRNLKAGEMLPVRSAPFENAGESGAVPAGSRFFVCSASHDRKWLGIVFDESGSLAERCGVSAPVARRADYSGPCRSGWVQSPFVKLVAGSAEPVPSSPGDSSTGGNMGDSLAAGA